MTLDLTPESRLQCAAHLEEMQAALLHNDAARFTAALDALGALRESQLRICGAMPAASTAAAGATRNANSRGFGPVIPGINHGPSVSGQGDVDSLLADLGM